MNKLGFFATVIMWFGLLSTYAQSSVMIKAYDKQLNPVSGMGISLDGSKIYTTGADGTLFIEVAENSLPPKSIVLSQEDFEAESWNYSKGILEIIIRKKSYRLTTFHLVNKAGAPIPGQEIKLNTSKPVVKPTNNQGDVTMPIPLNIDPLSTKLLEVTGFNLLDRQRKKGVIRITIEPQIAPIASTKPFNNAEGQQIEFAELDSIQSLTTFYGFIKNIDIQRLSDELRARIDAKFYALMSVASDSIRAQFAQGSLGIINDSTLVLDDIAVLIEQARSEEQNLIRDRQQFDQQIEFINQKLQGGGGNLDEASRDDLLRKIQDLDRILTANSEYFARSANEYHQILTSMRNRLLNIKDLEDKLTDVQLQRDRERKNFREQLLIISLILIGLAFITFVLLFLIRKINRQKKEIKLAHGKVAEINEHLEELVDQRTELLKKTNEELDTFMYRSSHDLRRPLTSMLGLVEVARMTLGSDALDLFDRVADTAQSMDRMLQKLIMVSHINQPCDTKLVDISGLPQKYEQKFEDLLKESDITIDWSITSGLQHETCPVMLDIIMSNLLENSLRFTDTLDAQIKPSVKVNMHQLDDHLILEIEDQAGGIEPDVQSKIWNMFYVGTEASKGNGLGLYVTRRAVDKLGASIDFKCADKSTVFTVRIPSSKVKRLKVPELVAV